MMRYFVQVRPRHSQSQVRCNRLLWSSVSSVLDSRSRVDFFFTTCECDGMARAAGMRTLAKRKREHFFKRNEAKRKIQIP